MKTQRRIEVEKYLPEGSQYLCQHLWNKFAEAGIQISQDDIVFISRCVSDYIKNTQNGKHTALKLLNADLNNLSPLNTYYPEGHFGDDRRKIPAKDLVEFKGYIYQQSKSIPHHCVEVDDREDSVMCDKCGGKYPFGYCATEIEMEGPGQGFITVCNHCKTNSENPRLRSHGDVKKCDLCPKKTCEFHPKHFHTINKPTNNVIALPPPRAISW